MNFIVNVILQHVIAAFTKEWKTTAVGCVIAAIGVLQASIPLMQGHPIDQIPWISIAYKMLAAIGLVLAKDITIEKVIFAAPKAEPVKDK